MANAMKKAAKDQKSKAVMDGFIQAEENIFKQKIQDIKETILNFESQRRETLHMLIEKRPLSWAQAQEEDQAQVEADSSQEADVQEEHKAQPLLFEPFVPRRLRPRNPQPLSLPPAPEADAAQAEAGEEKSYVYDQEPVMLTRRHRKRLAQKGQ